MTIVVESLNMGGAGPSVMVKDTIDIAGSPTRASSRALEQATPAVKHADVVQRLLDAGCRITGKTNLHELAFGTTGINHYTGTAINPRFPELIPGGSSSGSAAAVAAGLADFSLGTDTGGSVRVPACCCGVFGFKPSFGRVSRQGVIPAATTLDCVGPFAASLPMLITAMAIIDPSFSPATAPASLNIGVLQVPASKAVSAVVQAALSASGQHTETVECADFEAAYSAGMVIINRETHVACGHLLAAGKVGADIAGRLQAAGTMTDAAIADAEQVRDRFTAQVDAALQQFDVLVLPTMPDFPLRVEDAADTRAVLGMTSLVRPFNLSGHPAVTLPLASPEGLPVGLQLIGAKGDDEALLAAATLLLQRICAGAQR
ncbi:amidase [Pseudomonas auratipiscis]|uniref:Amidase n=1 Tax=Pseudomonas auratipiscis TaxID=3115853 RepID=A0AB35WKT0_9PSED|nr:MULTISPECIES: amidase [unclassified Pseudomonas]MEE1864865.1 amidase [Pseudomonas sp. 120P]MEE1956194.1 amidase [Pseudomonas sp. 119P]